MVPKKYSALRSLLILALGLCAALLLAWQVAQPLRPALSDRYLSRGDSFLEAQDYGDARAQYAVALRYNPDNALAKAHDAIAAAMPTDPAKGEQFYLARGVQSVTNRLAAAQKQYSTPKEALQAGVTLYVGHDYGYARYPLERAVSLDPGYAEAWNYLGLNYQELAKVDASFAEKARQALAKRDSITTRYLEEGSQH